MIRLIRITRNTFRPSANDRNSMLLFALYTERKEEKQGYFLMLRLWCVVVFFGFVNFILDELGPIKDVRDK